MNFSHFPDELYWSKLDLSITEDQFAKLPYMTLPQETDGKLFI